MIEKKAFLVWLLLLFVAVGSFAAGYILAKNTSDTQRTQEAEASKSSMWQKGFDAGARRGVLAGRRHGLKQGVFFGKQQGGRAGWGAGKRSAGIPTEERPLSEGNGVLVVGDSLEVLTSPYLENNLQDLPFASWAKSGYTSTQIYKLFQKHYTERYSVVVFDAGTNDDPSRADILAENIERVRRTIGPNRCLILPTIYHPKIEGIDTSAKNQALYEEGSKHPLVSFPDWQRVAKTKENLLFDALHPNPQGAKVRAKMLEGAIRECLEKRGGLSKLSSNRPLQQKTGA